jgi:hypothetical protein
MKRIVPVIAFVICLSLSSFAQTSTDDSPATKADVERYFHLMNTDDMMKKMTAAMAGSIQKMLHEQYLKHQDELPADYESKMNKLMHDMFADMPWNEMFEAMVPAYQKHLTKGDIDNLVAFYSTPTGAKVLHEMPAMMSEAMQDMMPIMTKHMESIETRLKKETDDMIAQGKKPADDKAPAAHN